jgi:hypothetical protein
MKHDLKIHRMAAVFMVWAQMVSAMPYASTQPRTADVVLNPGVFPIHSKPYGLSYGDWSAKWWQWAYGIPFSTNPIYDTTGADCSLNQSGPVWFLAGTAGMPVTRTCTIPAGKSILFPILNVVADYPCPDPTFHPAPGQTLADFLTQTARDFMDNTTELDATVDGVALKNLFVYRATSRMFAFTGDTSMTVFDSCITGTRQPGVSDGYWIMLAPLAPGTHTIHFHGLENFNPGTFELDVTYDVTVAPR